MNRKIILLAAMVFSVNFVFGQIANFNDVNGAPLRKITYDFVEGSAYLDGPDWKVGTMTDVDGKIYSNAQLRFNCYGNELEFMRSSGPIVVRKEQIRAFDINVSQLDGSVETFRFSSGFEVDDEVLKTDYVRVIYAGENFSIVQKIKKDIIKVTPASYGEKDYEKFIEEDAYYFIGQNKKEEIKLNRKNFYELFPTHKADIKAFVKKNGVNFTDIKEVGSLSSYIDESL